MAEKPPVWNRWVCGSSKNSNRRPDLWLGEGEWEADESVKELFNDAVLNYGADELNTELRDRLMMRKDGLEWEVDRHSCFVDFIDADEGRL